MVLQRDRYIPITRLWHRRYHTICLGLAAGAMLLLQPPIIRAQPNDFSTWLKALRAEARQRGISHATLNDALSGLQPLPRVIALDRKQPEGRLTFAQYRQRVITKNRVRRGQRLLRQHRKLLTQVTTQYGVPGQVIVALWSIESDFGRLTGGFPVIAALATLAHDERRSAFFRTELLHALQIIDEGHIAAKDMTGSWAGAMGQSQFMPSSFLSRAVDFDGDGRRDIWNTLPDVFASTANYLILAGWHQGETWGQYVTLPTGLDTAVIGLDRQKSIADWQALGVRRTNGNALPTTSLPASLVAPSGPQGPTFLVFNNYRVFLKWNRSTYFALAVGQLADRIGTGP